MIQRPEGIWPATLLITDVNRHSRPELISEFKPVEGYRMGNDRLKRHLVDIYLARKP